MCMGVCICFVMWVYEYMGVWVCGYVGMWECVNVGKWVCGYAVWARASCDGLNWWGAPIIESAASVFTCICFIEIHSAVPSITSSIP